MCTWALMQLSSFGWMPTIGHPRWIDAESHDVVFPIDTGLGCYVTVVTGRQCGHHARTACGRHVLWPRSRPQLGVTGGSQALNGAISGLDWRQRGNHDAAVRYDIHAH